jgi:hypothetical protein
LGVLPLALSLSLSLGVFLLFYTFSEAPAPIHLLILTSHYCGHHLSHCAIFVLRLLPPTPA